MRIAFDLSAIQSDHRLRGIGQTVTNIIENIPEEYSKKHTFIFYMGGEDHSVLEELNLGGIKYETRQINPASALQLRLPGRLGVVVTGINQLISLKDYYFGDSRITNTEDVDVFIQCDQSQPLPKRHGQKNVYIAYDIIPYILSRDYLWDYKITRTRGYSRRYATRQAIKRWFYIKKLRVSGRKADLVLAISEQTKNDFIKYVHVAENKIETIPLGVPNNTGDLIDTAPQLFKFIKNSWGYKKTPITLTSDDNFLLYVGGADPRRKVEDLVSAYNQLRATGNNLKLVLAGDSMQGPSEIANSSIRRSLESSSYKEDIIFMGFVPQQTREWLYKNALAYVYPSKYEGFGLPVLEAMAHGTPVICYRNSATEEVAGALPIYTEGSVGIKESILKLINTPATKVERDALKEKAKLYDWLETTTKIMKTLEDIK